MALISYLYKEQEASASKNNINYYVISAIFIVIVIYEVANFIEPEDDTKFDFFEVSRMLGFGAVSIFAFVVAKRYWGSQIFGKAYLALAIGYALYFMGDLLWYVYEIGYQIENPYPYYPDIGYFGFYPFAIYHLKTNVMYFKKHLGKSQKALLIVFPIGASLLYSLFSLVPLEAEGGIANLTILPIPSYEFDFYKEFLTGLAYIAAAGLSFAYVIIGAQIFRGTVLGPPWGLLLASITLNTFADMHYYYFEIFGDFVRSSPVQGIWMASTLVLCYALYKHRSVL